MLDGTVTCFKDFLDILNDVSDETLFGTEMVQVLISYFWDLYSKQVLTWMFFPFLLNLASAFFYFIDQRNAVGPLETAWDYTTLEFWNRWVFLLLTLYFFLYEMVQIKQSRLAYFLDIFNWFDLSSAVLNILLICSYGLRMNILTDETYAVVTAIAISIMFFKVFYWLRFFDSTSHFVRLIIESIREISAFFFLFFLILLTFGTPLMFMSPKDPEKSLISHHFNNPLADIIFSQYLLALGEFESLDAYDESSVSILAWLFFFGATFLVQITFLNLLIAIMGAAYDKIMENKEQARLREKI